MEGRAMDELEATVSEISAGFTTLCTEFTALYARQQALCRQLKASSEECEALRRLCPESTVESISSVEQLQVNAANTSAKSLDDCLRDLQEQQQSTGDIALIQQAVMAARRWRDPLEHIRNRVQSRPQAGSSVPTAKSGCPFAAMEGEIPINHHPVAPAENVQSGAVRMPPLNENVPSTEQRTKRLSFNDPLESAIQPAAMPDPDSASEVSEIACPIRFLDQHSPEELAKYFEDHKHELPRSHEVCVKRFQTNADSIRELDARYGSLVTMIQGLGQKHQPMLPLNPPSESVAVARQASESDQKIKDWARSVSDQAVADGDTAALEERMGHFDRPLKGIRVGESPSRPWGVPIPSKYLDAAELIAENPVPEAEPVSQSKVHCPIDHTKVVKEPGNVTAPVSNEKPNNTRSRIQDPHSSSRPRARITITNRAHGLIACASLPDDIYIDNSGALLLGVDDQHLKQYFTNLDRDRG